ncbi:phage portal protein [Hymenobacter monticola]|uniref:Phage portal protein n=1 Tax=Hymenobacter monticola TaxID=1705399 RepID=A0ABY4B547_9BACT|nr:phage portal protein [Hymenobacter monticola]UOE32836.1 phage portal protein [Hymenobacter monticola]
MARTSKPKTAPQITHVNLAEVKLPEIRPSQLRYTVNDWVPYGESNNFPDYLIKSARKSPIHSSFINTRQNLIKGEGVTYSDDLAAFLEALDEDGCTINELCEQVATDLSILETFAVAVRYDGTRKNIIHLDYIDSSMVRPDKNLDELGKIQGYWVCADWSNTTINVPTYFEKFNPSKVKQTTQLYFYHKRGLGQPFLPDVSYLSALGYIELGYELSKYSLNSVLNGFFASGIMSVKANMTEEQKGDFQRAVKNSFQGSENASKLMVVVSEDVDTVKIEPLNAGDNTPMLNALDELVTKNICTAHQGNPIIASIQTDGSTLGSDGKLYRDSLEIYYNTVIKNLQNPFIRFMKKVLDFNGFKEYEFEIASSALMTKDIPDWVLQDYIQPKVVAAMYGFKEEDLTGPQEPQNNAPDMPLAA